MTWRVLSFGLALLSVVGCSKSKTLSPPKESVFRYSIDAKIPSLDPHRSRDVYSAQVQALAYESLYHYDYFKRPYEIVPLLADGFPKWSKDRKTLTINLKRGIFFHEDACFGSESANREFKASDVVYMFHRHAAPGFQSPFYGELDGVIEGVREFHQGKAKSITGIRELADGYSIELKLVRPHPRLLYQLADAKSAIVPRECVEKYGDGFSRRAVGTGAFKIIEADLNSRIVAVRNPNYRHMVFPQGHGDDSGKKLPLVDKVVFDVVVEKQPQWLKFLNGETEMVNLPKENVETYLPHGNLSPELQKRGVGWFHQPRASVSVAVFNLKDPVWGAKKQLRQAFALALDIPKIIEIQYSGQALPANSLIDPTMYGYNPERKSPWSTRDLKKARALLAGAGYPDGKGLPPLLMPTLADTNSRILDELLTRQLSDVGIVLKSIPMTWPEMMRREQSKDFTVIVLGMASGMPDVNDLLPQVQSKFIEPGQNSASFVNSEVDALAEEIAVLENGPARLSKINRLVEILNDELPYVPLLHQISNQLVQPWVKNHVFVDNMLVGPFMKYQGVQTLAGSK